MEKYYILDSVNARHRVLKTIIFPVLDFGSTSNIDSSHKQLLICVRLWLKMGYKRLIIDNWDELTLEFLRSKIGEDRSLNNYFECLAKKIGRKILVFQGSEGKPFKFGKSEDGFSLSLHYTEDSKWGLYGFASWIENNSF